MAMLFGPVTSEDVKDALGAMDADEDEYDRGPACIICGEGEAFDASQVCLTCYLTDRAQSCQRCERSLVLVQHDEYAIGSLCYRCHADWLADRDERIRWSRQPSLRRLPWGIRHVVGWLRWHRFIADSYEYPFED